MSDKVENQMSAEEFWGKWIRTAEGSRAYQTAPMKKLRYKFAEAYASALASSRAPEGAERTSAIATLEAEWLSQDKIVDYRNWLQDKLLQSRAAHAHSEGVDAKELAELRAIVGRCEKTSPGVLGGRCDRPKGHRGSHETRNGMTTWLGPNDEPELSEGVDGWVRVEDRTPADSEPVFFTIYGEDGWRAGHRYEHKWQTENTDGYNMPFEYGDDQVIYWIPQTCVPAPPKEPTR